MRLISTNASWCSIAVLSVLSMCQGLQWVSLPSLASNKYSNKCFVNRSKCSSNKYRCSDVKVQMTTSQTSVVEQRKISTSLDANEQKLFLVNLHEQIDEILKSFKLDKALTGKIPPIQVDDKNLLCYDVFLIVNLVLSISFWVVHRLNYQFLISAFSEGCLLSLAWIGAGLYSGAFLNSAVDGNMNERDSPTAGALLGFQTFVNAINLRLVFALFSAMASHRTVGAAHGEEYLALEISFGLVLMSVWRMVYSSFAPRS